MLLKSIGSDPEILFVSGGKFTSVIGMLPGTKSAPFPVDRGSIQVDNVAGEFNTHPVTTPSEFSDIVPHVRDILNEYASIFGFEPSLECFAEYEASQLMHPSAREAGCGADFNAYTGRMNIPPNFQTNNYRCAGGHIHIGVDATPTEIREIVRALDVAITIPLLKHEHAERRKLYGKAGCFRPKEYGVEYRTPSNVWIFSKERCLWIAEQARNAVSQVKTLLSVENTETIINTHNLEAADDLIHSLKLDPFPSN